jgi:DnaJ family protein C protein 19
LIARVHPDTGGSAELAARVNDARDALVEELRRRTVRSS